MHQEVLLENNSGPRSQGDSRKEMGGESSMLRKQRRKSKMTLVIIALLALSSVADASALQASTAANEQTAAVSPTIPSSETFAQATADSVESQPVLQEPSTSSAATPQKSSLSSASVEQMIKHVAASLQAAIEQSSPRISATRAQRIREGRKIFKAKILPYLRRGQRHKANRAYAHLRRSEYKKVSLYKTTILAKAHVMASCNRKDPCSNNAGNGANSSINIPRFCEKGQTEAYFDAKVNGNDLFGITYWEWHLTLRVCFITDRGVIDSAHFSAAPIINPLGWWWDSYTPDSTPDNPALRQIGGLGHDFYDVYARGKFKFCPPPFRGQALGCIQVKDPWIEASAAIDEMSFISGGG